MIGVDGSLAHQGRGEIERILMICEEEQITTCKLQGVSHSREIMRMLRK